MGYTREDEKLNKLEEGVINISTSKSVARKKCNKKHRLGLFIEEMHGVHNMREKKH